MKRRALGKKNNSAGDNEEPQSPRYKRERIIFHTMELPKRRQILGQVLVCGMGDFGQLGLGANIDERSRPTLVENIPNPVDICAGGMHCLVLTKGGNVYSFGCNDEGALGRDTSSEGSEALPGLVDLPNKALCISAGDSHSACVLEDGRAFAWGNFRDSHGCMGLTVDGKMDTPINILKDKVVCSIASGADHLVLLTATGKVYTVGRAEHGQLGRIAERSLSLQARRGRQNLLCPSQLIVRNAKPFEAIWASSYCTFLRESQTETIWAVGLNNYKQLASAEKADRVLIPIKTNLKNVTQIAGGQHHTLILDNDMNCFAVGRPDYGRLGIGHWNRIVAEPTPIKQLSGKTTFVGCGDACSFAITTDGQLFSWGFGCNLQLGTGNDDDQLEPAMVTSPIIEDNRKLLASGGGQHSIFLVEADVKEVPENLPESQKKKVAAAAAGSSTESITANRKSQRN